jgi:hypothetical protein
VDSVTLRAAAQGTRSQRCLARLSSAFAAQAVVIVAVFAGLKSVVILAWRARR